MITLVHNDKELQLEDDEALLNHMMEEKSDIIPPEVFDAIKNGLTVYNEDESAVRDMSEETGMDPWDGESLVRWISQDSAENIYTK